MRVKKIPEKFVHCVVCNIDFNNLTMYHRHLTTYAHQLTSREEESFDKWLNLHRERILVISGNFRLIPVPTQELSQVPILKAFEFLLKQCNAVVDDMMWSAVQSGFLLMNSQQAVDNVAWLNSWDFRINLDEKNWVELKAAKNLTNEQWEQLMEDLD